MSRFSSARSAAILAAVLIVAGLGLAACGKKGAPVPSGDEERTYPRTYPTR